MPKGFKRVAEGVYTKKDSEGIVRYYERVQRTGMSDMFKPIPASTRDEARSIRASRVVQFG